MSLTFARNHLGNNAMEKLETLCQEVKANPYDDIFKKEILEKIIDEYVDAYGEKRATLSGMFNDIGRGLVYAILSIIPIAGALIGTGTAVADPAVRFLWERNKQKNLPMFISEVKKMRLVREVGFEPTNP
jgi:hypothetical protein